MMEAAVYQENSPFQASDAGITILEPTKNSGILNDGVMTEIPVLVKLSQSVNSGTTIFGNCSCLIAVHTMLKEHSHSESDK